MIGAKMINEKHLHFYVYKLYFTTPVQLFDALFFIGSCICPFSYVLSQMNKR